MTKRSLAAAVLLACASSGRRPPSAQDAHYWTYGYGPVGQLTEGTLVGGVNDLSAVYYNPGALALLDEPRFVINLTSIELANIDVPDAAGQNLDFEQLVFDIVPAMVAFKSGPTPGGQSLRGRAALASRLGLRPRLRDDAVSGASTRGSAGFGRYRQRAGRVLGRRHLVAPRVRALSVGVSPFVRYRGQRSRRALDPRGARRASAVSSVVRRHRERVQPRPPPREDRRRLATRSVGARRDGDAPGVKVWGNGKSSFNASRPASRVTPLLSARSRRTSSPPTTGPGRWLGGRRGGTTARRSTARSSGSRRSPRTISSSSSRRPSRAARRRSPSPSSARPRASSTSASASSGAWATVSCSTGRGPQRVGVRSRARVVRGLGPDRRDGRLHVRHRAGEDRLRGGLRLGERRGDADHRPARRLPPRPAGRLQPLDLLDRGLVLRRPPLAGRYRAR